MIKALLLLGSQNILYIKSIASSLPFPKNIFSLPVHIYTLAGITVSLGIIIDSSIMMADHYSYYRNRTVFSGLLGATATTIGALCIILLLPEKDKANLEDFSKVIMINLSVSLLTAWFFVPSLLDRFPVRRNDWLRPVRSRRRPKGYELAALLLALGGTFILATHGNPGSMALSPEALWWGIGSAAMMAVYNLLPGKLMKKYGTFCVIGWGMLVGGTFLSAFTRPWHVEGQWDLRGVGAIAVVIVVGTVLSFSFYMEGVRLIGAPRASLLASVEPVTATIASALFMHVVFVSMDVAGIFCILAAVLLLSAPGLKR